MNVSLTEELEKLVNAKVASGRYRSASEVIREGLRLLEERDQLLELRRETLRERIREGVEQAERGELLDGDEGVAEARRRIDERRGGGAGRRDKSLVQGLRGRGSVRMTTDEILALTRDDH